MRSCKKTVSLFLRPSNSQSPTEGADSSSAARPQKQQQCTLSVGVHCCCIPMLYRRRDPVGAAHPRIGTVLFAAGVRFDVFNGGVVCVEYDTVDCK